MERSERTEIPGSVPVTKVAPHHQRGSDSDHRRQRPAAPLAAVTAKQHGVAVLEPRGLGAAQEMLAVPPDVGQR